jgi:hypothetical protein
MGQWLESYPPLFKIFFTYGSLRNIQPLLADPQRFSFVKSIVFVPGHNYKEPLSAFIFHLIKFTLLCIDKFEYD